jgi:hypothetical protein
MLVHHLQSVGYCSFFAQSSQHDSLSLSPTRATRQRGTNKLGRCYQPERPFCTLARCWLPSRIAQFNVRLKPDGTRWRTGREVKGKLANGVGIQCSHTTSEHGVSSITTADVHTSAASSRLNWRPRRFKWTGPFRRKTESGFYACAIIFQTHSTYMCLSAQVSVRETRVHAGQAMSCVPPTKGGPEIKWRHQARTFKK